MREPSRLTLEKHLEKFLLWHAWGSLASQFSLIGELQTPDPVSKSKTEN